MAKSVIDNLTDVFKAVRGVDRAGSVHTVGSMGVLRSQSFLTNVYTERRRGDVSARSRRDYRVETGRLDEILRGYRQYLCVYLQLLETKTLRLCVPKPLDCLDLVRGIDFFKTCMDKLCS